MAPWQFSEVDPWDLGSLGLLYFVWFVSNVNSGCFSGVPPTPPVKQWAAWQLNHFPPQWSLLKNVPPTWITYLSSQRMLWGTSFLRLFLFRNKKTKYFFLVLFPVGNTIRRHVFHYISYLSKFIPMPREQLNQKADNTPEFWCKQMASKSKLLISFLLQLFFFPLKIVEKFWFKMKTKLWLRKPPQSFAHLFWQQSAD